MNTELKRKATELNTDDTLEFMAENMGFVSTLCKDAEFIELLKNEASIVEVIELMLRKYRGEIKRAVLWVNPDDIDGKNAKARIDDVVAALLNIIFSNDDFFTSPETEAEQTPSTSHSENTEVNEQ